MQFVLTDAFITINSVNLSNRIDSVALEETYVDVDTTAFGQKSKTRTAGLGDHKFTVEFQQDEALASVEATIGPLVGLPTQVVVRPTSGITSATNPGYTFTVVVLDWKPLDGKVGDLVRASVTWPVSGDVLKSVS